MANVRAAAATRGPTALSMLTPRGVRGAFCMDTNAAGGPLDIGGLRYERGIGVRGASVLKFAVPDDAVRFEAWVGPDTASPGGAPLFRVYADDELVFDSGPLPHVAPAEHTNPRRPLGVRIPLEGVRELVLVTEAADGAAPLANWGGAQIIRPATRARRARPTPPPELAPTPPLGWNSWNTFGPHINEALIHETAEALIATGLRDAGYVYVCLDDGWQGARGDEWDAAKFPGGMRALGDFLHARGLKFGIYTRPAWVNGEEQRVATAFAAWGVDYIKYDFSDRDGEETNARMIAAVRAAGRPIVFNVCEWGCNRPWEWAARRGAQSWRVSYDVVARWDAPRDSNAGIGILTALDQTEALGGYAGPGHWNDPDMLVVGLGGGAHVGHGAGCSSIEQNTQFGLWALLAAPLLLGCDVRGLDAPTRALLSNRGALAINQDPLGTPAVRVRKLGPLEVLARPLAKGDVAVGLLNRGETSTTIAARWADLGIRGPHRVHDLWDDHDLGVLTGQVARPVPPHGLALLRLTPVPDRP